MSFLFLQNDCGGREKGRLAVVVAAMSYHVEKW